MARMTSREIHLTEYPIGVATSKNFKIVTRDVPDPAPGECLVRNIWMSVDPYMRGRMRPGPSFVPTFELGKPLEGGCVGQVVASRNGPFAEGEFVLGEMGWREYWLTKGEGISRVNPKLAPLAAYLGVMGMPGMTAYVGLLRIGEIKPAEMVLVSAAAGAVGSIACQIARLKGCRVVGMAGNEEKVAWLTNELGVDRAINYKKTANLSDDLAAACPKGIDVYFDNVGGAQLDAAIRHMARFGRVVACGMVSQYNAESPPPGPGSIFKIIPNRLRIQGFIVFDHRDMQPAFEAEMAAWIKQGKIKWKDTVLEGIENAPAAFAGLFVGRNFGKMLVKLAPDPTI